MGGPGATGVDGHGRFGAARQGAVGLVQQGGGCVVWYGWVQRGGLVGGGGRVAEGCVPFQPEVIGFM
jgi:hypothetical protein